MTAHTRASWHDRDYRTRDEFDGPTMDVTLGGAWVVTPTVRADGALGWGRDRPEMERWRHERRWVRAGVTVALRAGLHRRRQRGTPRDGLRGQLVPAHRRRAARGRDLQRAPVGAQPGARLAGLQPAAVRGARGPQDQRAALRLRANRRRAAVREAVLERFTDCPRSAFLGPEPRGPKGPAATTIRRHSRE